MIKPVATMSEILLALEEEESYDISKLAKKLAIPIDQLRMILTDLNANNVVEYDKRSNKVKLSSWLSSLDQEVENIKPAAGTFILPKNQEIKIQDMVIGNFTDSELELNIRLKAKLKEIAICKPS
jgi:predicted transcriptional regulator